MTYWFARLDPAKTNSAFAPIAAAGWIVTFALAAALAMFVVIVLDAGGSPLMQFVGIAAGVLMGIGAFILSVRDKVDPERSLADYRGRAGS
ncbi:hypothetical protein L5876_05110 [Hyphobacterium sp. SN044]|uniref:hypothetical protein n=1 Tax=Hyphobacterium sp. SN044 TaxID=2912575 RepID=UPI001F35985F|nr:hypothetical protein [Hyphobacterium sp. SN044]MCF8879189.1 hypothetical protein [Hyphobacterium sp. SN044]